MNNADNKTRTAAALHQKSSDQSPDHTGERAAFFGGETSKPFFNVPVQAKLAVNKPGDQYEQEADNVADKVVQRLAENKSGPTPAESGKDTAKPNIQRLPITPIQRSAQPSATPAVIQAKCAACEGEEKLQKKEDDEPEVQSKIQRKPIFDSAAEPPDDSPGDGNVQRKPIFESEAGSGEMPLQRSEIPGAGAWGNVQMKCADCAAEEKEEQPVQRKESGNATPTPSADFNGRLQSSKGGGSPLPADVSASMGEAMGADFSGVRVHTGSEAAGMSSSIQAQAFTHGSDIYFNEGKYDTGSTDGKRLLAHELTHTVQQGGVQRKQIQTQRAAEQADIGHPDIASAEKKDKTVTPDATLDLPDTAVSDKTTTFPQTTTQSVARVADNTPQEKLQKKEEKEEDQSTEQETKREFFASPSSPPDDELPADNQPAMRGRPSSDVQAKPNIQREEADQAALAAELRESEQDQVAAISTTEANQTREKAAKEGQEAQEQAQIAAPVAVPTPPAPIPEAAKKAGAARVAKPKKKKAASIEKTLDANAPELGPGGQQLAAESENACQDAADKTQQLANNEQAHDTAAEKTGQAEGAVVPPAEEGLSRSNADQVETVGGTPEPAPDQQAAKQELDAAVENAVPSDIEGMNKFESGKKGQVIGNQVLAVTSEQVGEVKGTYQEIENAPPPAAAETPTPIPGQEQAPDTPALNVGKDAVPELSEEQTDASKFEKDADNIYEKEGVTPELKAETEKVDSGDIGEANTERKNLKEKVATEPTKIQTFAKDEKKGVETGLKQEEQKSKAAMKAKRRKEMDGAQQEQVKAKSAMELKREAVTNWINARYEKAKTFVDTTLKNLEAQSLAAFDAGQKALSTQFERNVKRRINAWKDDRYSGLFGGVKWLRDKLFGIDKFPEVKQIFTDERAAFVQGIDQLIANINKSNNDTIKTCKDEIAKANKEIQVYVSKLAPDLRDVGKKAQKATADKLKALDNQVDEAKKKLQEALCKKRDEAIKAIDKKIEQMKSEMSGLVNKIAGLLLELAKKFFKWALEKIGANPDQLLGLLDKGAAVLKKLFTDPIGFFKNLGKAVGKGVGGFVDNIGTYLKKGLSEWLLGAMGDSGLKLPETFDLKGILSIGLQVVGATWDYVQGKLVKALGPNGQKMLDAAKGALTIVQRVQQEGPIALWHMFMEKVGEIKEAVFNGIKDWAITQIVKKASLKLLSMLNPAGAILQAIMLLYDVVMFFVENWQKIISFVESVFNSITNIANGAIGQAAAFIEKALAKTVPMMISFLANFIGLGGIGKTIRKIIDTLRKPIDKVVDLVVKFLVKAVKKVFGRFTGKKNKNQKPEDPQKEAQLQKGLADIDKEEQKYLTGGKITKEEADKVAATVKRNHPVFKSIKVVDGGEKWKYHYKGSEGEQPSIGGKDGDNKELKSEGKNIIERISDIVVSNSIFEQPNLSLDMKKRYDETKKDLEITVSAFDKDKGDLSLIVEQLKKLEERIKVLKGVLDIGGNREDTKESNIAFGNYQINLENETISGNFVSVSGRSMKRDMVNIDKKIAFMPSVPKTNPFKLENTRKDGKRADQDSERKIINFLLNEVKAKLLKIKNNELSNYKNKTYSGFVEINTEMSACTSCSSNIDLLKQILGNQVDIKINYGVKF
jgi:Domain of unknown function (DUF4157)